MLPPFLPASSPAKAATTRSFCSFTPSPLPPSFHPGRFMSAVIRCPKLSFSPTASFCRFHAQPLCVLTTAAAAVIAVQTSSQVGVAGVSSLILWFSWQTVWHLSFTFPLPFGPRQPSGQDLPPSTLGSLSLQQVSTCCALLSFGVLMVPGMVAFGARQIGMGVVFG